MCNTLNTAIVNFYGHIILIFLWEILQVGNDNEMLEMMYNTELCVISILS